MKPLKQPKRLMPGDRVAVLSPSSGIAAQEPFVERYHKGFATLRDVYHLEPIEMPHTTSGVEALYQHPEWRAADIMEAFADPSIKGIITCIGGEDGIRVYPYLDTDVIAANPKWVTGMSDVTAFHFMCYHAGISFLYGGSELIDFQPDDEPTGYTQHWLEQAFFADKPAGVIPSVHAFEPTTTDDEQTRGLYRLQGEGVATGRLLGGCLEVLSQLRGTELFPSPEEFDDVILFMETSPLFSEAWFLEDFLRALAVSGALGRLSGILMGRPLEGKRLEEYNASLTKVLAENGLQDMPVFVNANFGHNNPRFVLPAGVLAQLDCEHEAFSLLEPAGI